MILGKVSVTQDAVLPSWSLRLISEFDAADRRVEDIANGLSPDQLN